MEFYLPHINTDVMVGIIAFLLVFYFTLLKGFKKNRRAAPEAGGAWPIIGHLHLLGGDSTSLPHKTLGAMADKYGPIFTVRLGFHRVLVVSNSEIAKECFTTYDSAVSSRPKFTSAKYIGYNSALLGFSPYGPYWRQLRKFISLELLGQRRVGQLKHVRVSETEISIKELHKIWTEKKESSGFVLVEMKQWLMDLSLNVVVRMVVGKRYYGSGGGGGGEQAHRCQKLFSDFFRFLGLNLPRDVFPFLGWLDLGGHEKAMKETGKELDDLAAGWLAEHRRKRDSGEANGDQDFMDFMISTLEGADLAGYDVDTINKATCLNLISGGAETTGTMLTWALSLLMNNGQVLKKAQEELDIHVGKERQVDESDVNKLIFLQAIVKETLRLYPAAPLAGPREFTEDCNIRGFYIPKGTRLTLNLWKLQRDPSIWSDPSEFKPERYFTTHKDVDIKGRHFEFIPFGAGRRACPGASLGIQMLLLVLAKLLHSFELSTPSDALIDMSESAGTTNIKATPLKVLITPRLSPNLY